MYLMAAMGLITRTPKTSHPIFLTIAITDANTRCDSIGGNLDDHKPSKARTSPRTRIYRFPTTVARLY